MIIKTFYDGLINQEVINYFQYTKRPFVLKNAFKTDINLEFLNNKFSKENVLTLNEKSDKERLTVTELIKKIQKGQKYRLRANTKLGNKIFKYVDTSPIFKIKGIHKNIFDYFLSFGKSSRQKTLFLSTKGCTFSKHAHVISGMILQLNGTKIWHLSKNRENFFSIKYKSLLNPNPLYVTEKNHKTDLKVLLEPGDLLYMPAYWFHYTYSDNLSISFSYFFTESLFYYFKNSPLMFLYQGFRNPLQAIIKSLKKEPEDHIFERKDIINMCNKIKNLNKRQEALRFFKSNDYS